MKKKLIVIGLDGSRLDYVRKWANAGYLPNFKKILENGANGDLTSVLPGPHSMASWISCFTGMNPGKHSIVYPVVQSGKQLKYVTASDIKQKRVWNYLSDNGKYVGVFDFPGLYPVDTVNGVMVSSCGAPIFAKEYTYPTYLKTMIDEKYGGRQIANCHYRTKPHLDNLYSVTAKRFELWNWFLENHDWDFFACHVLGTELLHHIYASFMDATHKDYDASFEKIMIDYYVYVDGFVGQLLVKYPNTNFVFVSDHGFCSNKYNLYVNNILEKHGYFIRKKKNAYQNFTGKVMDSLTMAYLKIPDNVRYFANKFMPSFTKNFRLPLSLNINWDESLSYSHFMGVIYVNRFCKQITSGSLKVSEVVDKIISSLEADESLKGKILKIYRKEELFKGPYMEDMPDIIPIYHDDYKKSIKSPSLDIIQDDINEDNIGSHTLEGLFMAYGPDFKQGFFNGLNIKDVAPTILHLFGLPIPNEMDGRCLTEVFNSKDEVVLSSVSTESKRYSGEMSNEEEEEVRKTLQKMGYL